MLLEITNDPRPYAWGSRTRMAEFLGRRPSGGPEAELWLGAHPLSPSRIVEPSSADGHECLESLISRDPESTLGTDRLSDRLPFLMKVLAVEEPLSLQVHPNAEQATRGFEAEDLRDVPEASSVRTYKDSRHKPEIALAIDAPFHTLVGLKPRDQRRRLVEELIRRTSHHPTAQEVLTRWAPSLEGACDAQLTHLVGDLLDGDHPELIEAVTEVVRSCIPVDRAASSLRNDLRALERLVEVRPGDPGILAAVFLNVLSLRAGEAAYIPPRALHAHLGGLAVEVMASSDNVVRGGLTDKHVDARELERIACPEPLDDPACRPDRPQPGIAIYRPHEPDFELHLVSVPSSADGQGRGTGETEIELRGPAIALVLDGTPRVRGRTQEHGLRRGRALFITADEPALTISGHGRVALAMAGDTRLSPA